MSYWQIANVVPYDRHGVVDKENDTIDAENRKRVQALRAEYEESLLILNEVVRRRLGTIKKCRRRGFKVALRLNHTGVGGGC